MANRILRVLNVEDQERDVALITRHLSRAGYDLHSERVETPEAMRAALEAQEWDVILCDYSMPHFSALAALALLKETGLDIPFIIISGTIGEEIAVEAMRAGAYDYLMKDNLVRLAPAIERQLLEAENRRARRRVEAELLESEAQYRRLIDTAYEGVWIFDAEMRTTYVNQRLAEMLGVTVGEMNGRSAFDFMDDASRADVERRWQHRAKGVNEQYDLRLRRKDGSDLWVIACATPIYDERGEFAGSLSMLTDITERKRAEEQLQQSQKMEAIGMLAGSIAHDFNNLLTAITGYSDLSLLHLHEEDPLHRNVSEIKRAAERAAGLTRQLLAFSRKQVLQPVVLDLNALVSELEKMLRRLIGEDVELRVVLAAEHGSIKADPGQIEQVVMNLVVNARDAMPQGGKLTIETTNVYLDEGYARQHIGVSPGPYAMLAVSDTGTGI